MRLKNMCEGVICLLPMIYVQNHDEIDITKQRTHAHMYLIIIVFISYKVCIHLECFHFKHI